MERAVLEKTQIPVMITPYEYKKGTAYCIEGDVSKSCGVLHFSHEFTFSVSMKNNTPKFLGGWEIACEDIDYPDGEEGVKCLEYFHPGLYEDVLTELKKLHK